MQKENFNKNTHNMQFQSKLSMDEEVEDLDKYQINKLLQDSEDFDYDSEEDSRPVVNFFNELHLKKDLKSVDIVFLVDCTASMNSIFKGVKKFIRKLVWDAHKSLYQYLLEKVDPIKVGLVMYRDHINNGQGNFNEISPVDVVDLNSDLINFKSVVMKMKAEGGGDEAEAVLDGIDAVINQISWRSDSIKFLYHLLDAPPHGKDFNKNIEDNYPDGCPCYLDHVDLLTEMRALDIHYNLVKLSDKVEKMINVFSEIYCIQVTTLDIKIDKSNSFSQTN